MKGGIFSSKTLFFSFICIRNGKFFFPDTINTRINNNGKNKMNTVSIQLNEISSKYCPNQIKIGVKYSTLGFDCLKKSS